MAEISKQALKVDNNQSFPNNNNGAITPAILRAFNVNMIDSMVDELSYNVDSGSWNQQIDALEQFTASASGLTTGSLLVTASAAGNVITFRKGDNSTFNVTVATGSIPDISNLNQATASLQQFTASAQVSINNLNTTTQSLLVETQNLELFSASALVSISNLNQSSASQQVSIDSLNSKTGSYATTGSNIFTSANTFTSISASSFVSASEFIGNGSKITGITASIALPILDEGIPQGNAFSMNFTGSGIGATVVGGIAIVSVYAPDSASFNSLTASFNAYTSSTNAFTASSNTSASLALYTASFDTGSRNLTFTKGDTQTFSVNIPDVSGSTGNFATTGSNTFIGDQTISGSLFISGSEVVAGPVTASKLQINGITDLNGTLDVSNDATFRGDVLIQSATPNLKLRDTSGGGFSSGYDLRVDTGSFEIYDDTHNRDVLSDVFNPSTSKHTTSLTSEILVLSGSDSVTLIGNVSASIISASTINGLGDPLVFSTSVDSRLDTLETATSSLFTSASLGLTTASLSGQTLTFSKGDGTTFGILIPDVSGSTIDTGSFATTGSNSFFGNQTIDGNVVVESGSIVSITGQASDGRVIMLGHSGSLVLGNNTSNATYGGLSHISSSMPNANTNLIFKTNSNTPDTIVSGSGNIFTNFTAPTAGFKRYVGGNNNIINNTLGFQLTGSATYSPTTSNNILNGTGGQVFLRTATSLVGGGLQTVSNNFINSQLALGVNAANHFERAISGSNIITNILNGGLALVANKTNLTNTPVVSNSLIGGGNVTVNMNSSSVSLANMQSQGTLTVTNDFSSSLSASTNFAQIIGGFTNLGNANLVYFSGSNSGTNPVIVTGGSMIGNLNGLNSSLGGDNAYLTATSLIGHGLALTGSSTYAIPTAANNTAGTLITGRFNQQGMLSAETVFAVGTGTSTTRKTGFLIDSGSNTFVEGTLNVSGATSLNGDLIITGSLTASLQEGFVYVGNASGITTTVATSSFGGTLPSGVISGSSQITDLGFVSSSVTASSLVTASVNLNTITFTKGDSSTFALTVDTGSGGGGGVTFPYSGSVEITGSVKVKPFTLSVASSTASIDMNESNYFILNLPTSSTTHIAFTNIIPGESINLLVSQSATAETGSIAFAPNIYFPGGNDYVATATGSAKDIVSFITFNNSEIYATNVKNLK
jgi:hypothetical protein